MGEHLGRDVGAVLQVVDREQHRLPGRQARDRGDDGVERPAPRQVAGHAPVRRHAERLAEVGQESRPGAQVTAQQASERAVGQREQARPQHLEVRLEEQRPLAGPAARGEHEAAGASGEVGGGLEQPGLADAGHPRDDDQPGVPGRRRGPGQVQDRQLLVAADQQRPALRWCARDGARRSVATQHLQVQRLALRVRIGAQLLGEPAGQAGVHLEGGGGPAGHGEGGHEVAVGAFVVGVGAHRLPGGLLGDVGLAGGGRRGRQQVAGLAAQRRRLAPERVRPLAVELGRQRTVATQEPERPLRRCDREGRLAPAQPRGGRVQQRAGRVEVEVDLPCQGVRRAGLGDEALAHHAAQPARERREVALRVSRRVVRPDRLDEPVDPDRRPSPGRQRRGQDPGLAGSQPRAGELFPVADHRQRPAHGHPDRHDAEYGGGRPVVPIVGPRSTRVMVLAARPVEQLLSLRGDHRCAPS